MSATTFDPNLRCPHCDTNVGSDKVTDSHIAPDGVTLFVYTENGHQISVRFSDVQVHCPDES